MSTPERFWNYRLMETVLSDGTTRLAIHEVHYRGNQLAGYSAEPIELAVYAEPDSPREKGNLMVDLSITISKTMRALELPVLRPADFPAPPDAAGQ